MLLSPVVKKAVGSLLIVQAVTIDEARKVIESDLYYTSGVVSCNYIHSCPDTSKLTS